jgi:putative protease
LNHTSHRGNIARNTENVICPIRPPDAVDIPFGAAYPVVVELVSPAGNLDKLKYAYLYGADAAYIGVRSFSLRARAENFNSDEYGKILRIKGSKKLYGALNIYFHQEDLKALEEQFDYLAHYPFDAFIISDIGVLKLIKKRFPEIELHLSTQANCINSEAAKMYRDMGFKRIILGREMSLDEIAALNEKVDIELEVFVHGAMCLAYSGRCFLSRYMADRSANRGDCAHSCRWQYRVLEEDERRGEYYPVVEGDGFTTILSSKDLCMIDYLADLKAAGVDAVKIEGRMKSIYYTAVTARAYRKSLDSLEGKPVENLSAYKDDLGKVSHREFSTGFYFKKDEIETPAYASYIRPYIFLGGIEDKVSENTYLLSVKNQIREKDTLEYVGFDILSMEDRGFSLLNEKKERVEKADHGKIVYLQTDKTLKAGYLIRKRIPESRPV